MSKTVAAIILLIAGGTFCATIIVGLDFRQAYDHAKGDLEWNQYVANLAEEIREDGPMILLDTQRRNQDTVLSCVSNGGPKRCQVAD